MTAPNLIAVEKEGLDSGPDPSSIPSDEPSGHLEPAPHHIYIKITADLGARQINGDVTLEETDVTRSKHVYYGAVATGESLQINGNVTDPETFRHFFSARNRS